MRLSGLDLNLHMVFDAVYEERSLEKAKLPNRSSLGPERCNKALVSKV
jgi:hypothetical protein